MKPSGRIPPLPEQLGRPAPAWGALFLLISLVINLAGGTLAQAGQKKDANAGYSTSPSSSQTPPPPKFNVPIPVGHDAEGVNLPYYDIRGRLQMFFTIQKALRVDLYHLSLENAFMQTYDEKEAPDSNVYMTRSVLDLNTRIVTSEVPVTVRRSDFQIVGNKMVFNTQTRKGHMSGHVRMTLYNRQEMGQASPSPTPGTPAIPSPPPIPGTAAATPAPSPAP